MVMGPQSRVWSDPKNTTSLWGLDGHMWLRFFSSRPHDIREIGGAPTQTARITYLSLAQMISVLGVDLHHGPC